ncbi:hypothetical protein GQ600_8264 [Phytophthora cactorum]|nr:hypothetical protein GQ600_8264 [Phytophthora cactorum]
MLLTAVPIVFDQQINAKIQPSFAKDLNICHSQTWDANLSNVGHSKRIRYLQTMAMTVTVSRVCSKRRLCTCTNSMPRLSPSAVLWVSSVTSFCYSMEHKCEDDSAKALFAAFVAVCENIESFHHEG